MNWLPSFLNWPAAAAAAAVVIPSLLVLYFLKLRRREMTVPSTLLWKKAIQDLQVNAPFQRLRRNLLLLLQLLLLILLLLSLARPVANYSPGAGKMTILLIDRSASMGARDGPGGKTRLEEAKRRALDLVNSMKRGSTAMVIGYDDSAETLQALTEDQQALRNAINGIQQTDRKSRLKMAYQLADAQLYFIPEQNRTNIDPPDVRVFSDGRVLDADELRIGGKVTLERIGSEKAGNIGIVALSAKRNYERPTEVQVFARLANFGPEPVDTVVQLSVNGERVDAGGGDAASGGPSKLQQTYLLPERWDDARRLEHDQAGGKAHADSVEFTLDLTDAATIRVEQMHKEGDVLAGDDFAQVVVPPPKTLAVLLVTEGNYFLEKVVDSLGLKDPATMSPQQYEQNRPQNFDVIIFDRYKPANPPDAGGFIHFGVAPGGTKLKPVTDPNGKLVTATEVGVLDWRRDHPILRQLAMSRLYVAEALKLDVPVESEVLLDGMKCPLIVMHREGKATHLVITFDILQSNWPLLVSWPIFMHNALQFLAVGSEMDVRQSFEPGATPKIPPAQFKKLGDDVKKIRLRGPRGFNRELTVPETGDFALPPLEFVGVYSTDPPVPGYEQMSVNLLDANESNVLPAAEVPGGVGEVRKAEAAAKSRMELWWWIVACAALPLLLIEWWVYTRRVHL